MAWEEIIRGHGCGKHSSEWLETPVVTIRQSYLTLNNRFQKQFAVGKGSVVVVRWDTERKVIGLEIGESDQFPNGFTVHVGGGKFNITTATVQCGNFCKRLEPWRGKSFKATKQANSTIIEIALLPDNEIR